MSAADAKFVESTWRERLVVVFRGQTLSTRSLLRSATASENSIHRDRTLTANHFIKGHPELNVISNVVENGKPIGNLGDGEAVCTPI